jgi:hypothetical protein
VADRVAHPFANGFRQVLRIHPDNARIVHHLGEDHHGVLGLHDLMKIVVEIVRQRRWSGCRTESEQTAFT